MEKARECFSFAIQMGSVFLLQTLPAERCRQMRLLSTFYCLYFIMKGEEELEGKKTFLNVKSIAVAGKEGGMHHRANKHRGRGHVDGEHTYISIPTYKYTPHIHSV